MDSKDAFMKLDECSTQLETVNSLLSVMIDNLLNFNHITPLSEDPQEKQNAITFCSNFDKLQVLTILVQKETENLQKKISGLAKEAGGKKL